MQLQIPVQTVQSPQYTVQVSRVPDICFVGVVTAGHQTLGCDAAIVVDVGDDVGWWLW